MQRPGLRKYIIVTAMHFATAEEMAELDRLAVESGLKISQMMELAGWHMLEVFDRLKIGKNKKT